MPQFVSFKSLTLATAAAFALAIATPSMADSHGKKKDDGPKANVGGIKKEGGASIKGIVLFDGKQIQPKPIVQMAGNPFCNAAHKGKFPLSEKWGFGKNGDKATLTNVLVYVSKGLEGKTFTAPKEAVILDQEGCVYIPHVVGVMKGQKLEIRNSDQTLHNVQAAPASNPAFNDGMPVKGMKLFKTFAKPEFKINLKCAVHPWMSSYVHVMENPFYAVTGKDGTFELHGLDAGTYEVSVVHEFRVFKPVKQTISVTVGAGESKSIEFTYQPPQKKK